MARQVKELLWVREGESPWPKVKRRPKGAKGLGLGYENALAKALPHAIHGPWFEYCDRNGRGFCQPDFVLVGSNLILVIECKLTNYPEACLQLANLYLPVLGAFYQKPERNGGS